MKICVIGDSHVGALKRASDEFCPAEFALTFFADRGTRIRGLELRDNVLVPDSKKLKESIVFTSGGQSCINLEYYDAFVLYGLQARRMLVDKKIYSKAVVKDTAMDHVSGTLSHDLFLKIREVSSAKIYIGHSPLRTSEGSEEAWVSSDYVDGIDALNDFIYSDLSAAFLPQPHHTIVDGVYTAKKFSQGSKRLSIGSENDGQLHPGTDSGHMNESYGKLWLTDFFSLLE